MAGDGTFGGSNNLYKNLHHIRTELARRDVSDPLVSLNGEMVELAAGVTVDADEFRESARDALASGDYGSLRAAAGLFTGDLLPEDSYEEWAEAPREDLRLRYVEVMLALAKASDAAGNHAECIDALQSLLKVDPLNEEAHRFSSASMRIPAAGTEHCVTIKPSSTCCGMSLIRSPRMRPAPCSSRLQPRLQYTPSKQPAL